MAELRSHTYTHTQTVGGEEGRKRNERSPRSSSIPPLSPFSSSSSSSPTFSHSPTSRSLPLFVFTCARALSLASGRTKAQHWRDSSSSSSSSSVLPLGGKWKWRRKKAAPNQLTPPVRQADRRVGKQGSENVVGWIVSWACVSVCVWDGGHFCVSLCGDDGCGKEEEEEAVSFFKNKIYSLTFFSLHPHLLFYKSFGRVKEIKNFFIDNNDIV